MRIPGVLVNLGMLPIQIIPLLPKSVWEVMPAVDLVLQCLQEALASSAILWDCIAHVWPFIELHTLGEGP
jgi:hypothetical protein